MTHITELGTVAVPVTDQDRAITFYVDVLGFEKRMDVEFAPGQRWVVVAPKGAATTIALVTGNDQVPAGRDTGIRLTTRDAAAEHAELSAQGVDVDAEILNWPGVPPMFSFRDPDANTLYLVQGY
ncbi:MAG TPA: VOC family protein [Rugosimonospora sp.]|nr:VOC family protein [Rugosimonospora sp.]